jgi:hypothetical protein
MVTAAAAVEVMAVVVVFCVMAAVVAGLVQTCFSRLPISVPPTPRGVRQAKWMGRTRFTLRAQWSEARAPDAIS